ncbi:DNA mismatch repair protein MutS [Croceicoccus sp. F390]|uniref:DNA mismatch repair protein MutS n=2 Tax=Croceicoccus esteveae TaxID=3075597 RepID=A0ABU2ZKQ7_9SPHN|nr:DNA mismatch repair protein MutS [Croceicoccus sp. F390]MDT0576801.1 DNA mismatch repair protein MutS [Croceicoccus sp. F390]
MLAQYLALKEQAPDSLLFYRMGDFFELFFDDARHAAAVLDIALTSRGEHAGAPVPMCGVPVHAAEQYLARLIRAGCRVAIAEQVESPAEAKARGGTKTLVRREIVRFVTAGTLTEDTLLDARRANVLAAVAPLRGRTGIACVDVSTGEMLLESHLAGDVAAALARIDPAEIIMPDDRRCETDSDLPAILRPAAHFSAREGKARLLDLHGVATLDGFGSFDTAALGAASGLIAYLEHVGCGRLPLLLPPRARGSDDLLMMDEATRSSLEIVEAAGGGRKGSLVACIDRCVTGAGARLLTHDLSAPLTDAANIRARLHAVRWFVDNPLWREDMRTMLRQAPDLARALARLVAGRGSPRDLGQLRDGLLLGGTLRERIAGRDDIPALVEGLLPDLAGHHDLVGALQSALIEHPPADRSQGGFIAEGYDTGLDELRITARQGRRAIATLEQSFRDSTNIAALKIRHNNVLGYFIEVPQRHAEALMQPASGFTHRQTMKGAVRFNAVALHEEAARIAEAGGRAEVAEAAHFEDLVARACRSAEAIAQTARALARLDVSAGQAERAAQGGWTQPALADEICLEIAGGRHPAVEAALEEGSGRFVANDCTLDNTDRVWLIGGPNMGGKSTFLRQNALIILLAQAGGFVPAQNARIGLVDRIFSRVGASDNLAKGRSTFMVEMVETAAILTQATARSFVILDEVGRGTSTYDGLALAWAVAENVHDAIGCRCLFATHYHELAKLAESCDALSLHHVRAREWKGELVLLHELSAGPADRSYGLAVARLAGLPQKVISRARVVLGRLEEGRARTGGLAAGLGELPLFAAAEQAEEDQCDTLREKLQSLNVDAITPKDALDILYDLTREARA